MTRGVRGRPRKEVDDGTGKVTDRPDAEAKGVETQFPVYSGDKETLDPPMPEKRKDGTIIRMKAGAPKYFIARNKDTSGYNLIMIYRKQFGVTQQCVRYIKPDKLGERGSRDRRLMSYLKELGHKFI